MKEPEYYFTNGTRVLFSQLPLDRLLEVKDGRSRFVEGEDVDFERRYAAVLLRERGL